MKLAEETAREKGGCAMLGSIIHNVHVVAELEALGARQVDSVEEVRPGETVIIRSHGERKEVFDRLEQLGAVCVNATCPNVLRIQQLVAQADREGRIPLIIGASLGIRRSWVWPAGRIAASSFRGRRSWKMAPAGAFPAVLSPDGGGSDHLHPNNLGKVLKKF